jgi:anti-sigma factor RsiW
MTCKEFIEFLIDYLGGELPRAQKALFEEHLEVCPSCVAYLSNYKKTVELAKAAFCQPEEPVPDDVPEELVLAILSARKAGER